MDHINIEVHVAIHVIIYVQKYIYKGHDYTTMQFGCEPNEVEQYLDAQYVSALEMAWHLFAMEMHEEQPNVVRLALHLSKMHRMVLNANDDAMSILQKTKCESTTLTTYFVICIINANVRQYAYIEFLEHFVWNTTVKRWTPRRIGFALGRLYFIDQTIEKHYCFQLFLTIVQGPTSFEDL